MPRPKGSKNKPKTVKATVDFAAQIAEKQSAKMCIRDSPPAEILGPPSHCQRYLAGLWTYHG